MKPISVLIVDDEKPARNKLRTFLKTEEQITIIYESDNGISAVQMIQEKKPDLVFLDIQMPGMTGFEVIDAIGIDKMPALVFVTAYDQFALNAFEVQAVDYLLKPFDEERFKRSFQRVFDQIQKNEDHSTTLTCLIQQINKERRYSHRILVSEGAKYFFIKIDDILYISAEEKYIKLHTEKGDYLNRDTMNKMEERLDLGKFARIHRSTIVNIDHITELQSWSHGDYIAILKNGEKLNVSRRYRENLFGKV
jgi:two-component system, LytTR family, response regulator